MRQIIHIFRKDVRQHWPVILFTLASLAAYAWDEPRHWAPWEDIEVTRFRWIVIMLILSWLFLVVRVIQSEALAGDRQYWITRPVEWKKLLAAKTLFFAAFVSTPALIVDVYLLARAGFKLEPAYTPGLLWMQVDLAALLVLTVAALAAVTSNFAQMMIAVLAVGIFMAGTCFVTAYLPANSPSDVPDDLTAAVVIGACSAVVLWQYARRKTEKSRLILAGAAGVILIMAVATPFIFPLAFPYPPLRSGEQPPVQLSLDHTETPAPQAVLDKKKDVDLHIPLRVSGVEEDSVVAVKGMRVTIEAQNGERWDSGWFSNYTALLPNDRRTDANFQVNKTFFQKTQGNNVTAHISFALTVSRDKNPRQVIATRGYFPVPDMGLCRITRGYATLLCLFPLRGPALVVVTTASSENTCPSVDGDSIPAGKTARGWGSNSESGPFSPVGTDALSLGQWDGENNERSHPRVCPGTPLLFSFPKVVRRVRMDVDLPGIRLADYQERNTFTYGLGIAVP